MSDLRQALQAALFESPDDRATCAAYADYLTEQADPDLVARGELMQVQLALEDPATPAAQRRNLRAREKRLLKKHERGWLGDLARWLLDGDASDLIGEYTLQKARYAHSWHRGFLGRIEVTRLSTRFVQALPTAPCARLLRELVIEHDPTYWESHENDPPPPRTRTPPGAGDHMAFHELIGAPCLLNLRVFQIGEKLDDQTSGGSCFSYTPGLEEVVAGMPRIEELYLPTKSYDVEAMFGLRNLTHLRVLEADHLRNYPLQTLAANRALSNLTSLGFHPHFSEDSWHGDGSSGGFLPLSSFRALVRSRHIKKLTHLRFRLSSMGDEGVALLLESGWLNQLRVLDLRHGCITDEGAHLLAAAPELKNLQLLDLTNNQLTDDGIQALKRTKVRLRCDEQAQVGSAEYLGAGDFE